MPRKMQIPNDLHAQHGASARLADALPAPPPFTFTPLGPDPSMGWSGWGLGTMAGWARAQAAAEIRRGDVDEQGPPRREPRGRVEPR